mgnify:CR=1 FL=1
MNYNDFIKLTKKNQPPNSLTDINLALWHAKKNNWDLAHNIVQNMNTDTAYWIHAYLHRFEGDLGNANYWYNRAGKASLLYDNPFFSMIFEKLPSLRYRHLDQHFQILKHIL